MLIIIQRCVHEKQRVHVGGNVGEELTERSTQVQHMLHSDPPDPAHLKGLNGLCTCV